MSNLNPNPKTHEDETRCCAVAILFHVPPEIIKADEEAYNSGKINNPTETFPQEYKDLMAKVGDLGKKHMCLAVTPIACEIDADVMFLWRAPEDEQKALGFYNECRDNGIDARLVKNAVYVPSQYTKVSAA